MRRRAAALTRPGSPLASGLLLQRKCSCSDRKGACGGSCGEKERDLRRTASSERAHERAVPPIVHDVLRSPGRPLDDSTRAFMEPRFGHDFARVRVHTGDRDARSAEAVAALAYTVGNDIVFGAGQYAPSSPGGMRVLAHELTHVVQQSGGATGVGTLRIGPAEDGFEREADAQATRVMAGDSGSALMRGGALQRTLQRQESQQEPLQSQQTSCPSVVATRTFSRGNDDQRECQYQTASIVISLLTDPCACTGSGGTLPIAFQYMAFLDGKSFANAAGTIPETQASAIGATLTLQEVGGPTSAPLVHTTGGGPGDPGDTLTQTLNLSTSLPCEGGSTGGIVRVARGAQIAQTITWSLSASSAGALSSSFVLTEATPGGRIPTPTVDVTGGGPTYPAFPGTPRDGRCTCHPVTGVHLGAGCPFLSGGAGFGGTTTPPTGGGGR